MEQNKMNFSIKHLKEMKAKRLQQLKDKESAEQINQQNLNARNHGINTTNSSICNGVNLPTQATNSITSNGHETNPVVPVSNGVHKEPVFTQPRPQYTMNPQPSTSCGMSIEKKDPNISEIDNHQFNGVNGSRQFRGRRVGGRPIQAESTNQMNQHNSIMQTNLSSSMCNGVNTATPQLQSMMNSKQSTPLEMTIAKKDPVLCSVPNTSEKENHMSNGVNKPKISSGRGAIMKKMLELNLKEEESAKQMNQQNVNDVDLIAHTNLSSSVCNEEVHTALPQLQSIMNSQQPAIEPLMVEENEPVTFYKVPTNSSDETYHMRQLESNYMKINIKEKIGIYEYLVDFKPPVDAKSARFYLVNCHKELYPVYSYDGAILYVPTMLQNNTTVLMGKLKDESEVTMTIQFKRKKKLGDSIHFYNILMHTAMGKLGFVKFDKSCYDPEEKILIEEREYRLEVWPGYVTAIDVFEDGIYLNCDVSHRVLRVETVLETLSNIASNAKRNNKEYKNEILACFCGSTVIASYSRKIYKIDDVDFSMTPLSTFSQHGVEISYVEYYKKMYGLEIKDYTQPMIITKPKKRNLSTNQTQPDSQVCLVPELCKLTGLTEGMKSDRRLMTVIHSITANSPDLRQRALIDLVHRIYDNEDASQRLEKWGLKINPATVKLEGPVYKRDNIILGNNVRIPVPLNMDWGSSVVKNAMFATADLNSWAILFSEREHSTVKSFLSNFTQCTKLLGMSVQQPALIKIIGDRTENYVQQLNNTIKHITDLQLVVIIVSNQRQDRYDAIKRLCCSTLGIPSQVILSRTLSSNPSRLHSVTQKIALQINCKLGGACWAIHLPLSNTMIVGIDVYHEKNHQMSSVVGLVASMDKTFTKWCSVAKNQKSTHQELLSSIQLSFHNVLMKYKDMNGVLPNKIIVYRDGVSDGDLKMVEEFELKELEKCFKTYPGDYNPLVTYIIVRKRINTKIYQYLDNHYVNPVAGTVIDNTITKRNFFDFFLVSQNVRQGTVNPTHYIVLQNGCNLATEHVQRLTYKLCHLYYNWCGTIKVPCAVQYAHKLAFLVGQNLRGHEPNQKLTNTLFFL